MRRALVVLVVLVMAAAVGGTVALAAPGLVPAFVRSPMASAPPVPRPQLGPLPANAPLPTQNGLAAVLRRPVAGVPGTVTGVVRDATTGSVLWQQDADRPMTPGSTGKLVTSAAALLTLSPTDVLVTRAVAGPEPGSVVLVGGGDPTLTALPPGKEGIYSDPARLTELAAQVKAAMPGPISTVYLDTSRYVGPTMAPGWDPADIAGGFITPIEPLMLDGGRLDPTQLDGARTDKPAEAAGRAFAKLVGAGSVERAPAPTDPAARTLASVTSPPVTQLVENALRVSDNVLAEVLSREVAIERHGEASFTGGARETAAALTRSGIDVTGLAMVDGSGLSTQDRVPAKVLGAVVAAAAAPTAKPQDVEFLRPILSGLPVAGGDGTLDDRFTATSDAAKGRGVVRAKTGSLTGVSSLGGIVTDVDGRLLVFALMNNGANPADARPKLDDVVAAVSTCGCR